MFRSLWKIAQTGAIAVERFFDEAYTYRASALAFTTLLALVPLLTVIVFFITAFPWFTEIIFLGEKYILENFVPTSAASIEYYFQGFILQATRLPAASILFLVFTTILLVHTIEETLNDIWNVPRRIKGHKLLALLTHWLIFLFIPIIIGVSVFVSSYAIIFTWKTTFNSPFDIDIILSAYLPIIINTMIFTLLYVVVPNIFVPWREGLLGGFLAALLFETARIGFALYVKQFPSYALIYGAFAAVPIFLLWLYVFWFIILFGALFIHTRSLKRLPLTP